jgi:hypothetical protein
VVVGCPCLAVSFAKILNIFKRYNLPRFVFSPIPLNVREEKGKIKNYVNYSNIKKGEQKESNKLDD